MDTSIFILKKRGGDIDGLTIKQEKFSLEYINSGNATESYKKAGYKYSSENMASVEAHKLLRNPKVKAYIDEKLKEIESEKIANHQEILEFLTSTMRGEQTDQIFKGVGEGVQELIEVRVSTRERIKAAELLGKRYSMWTDKIEAVNEVVVIKDDI